MHRLAVVILNYRTPELVIDCLRSLVPQLCVESDRAIVVDNCSDDDSPSVLRNAIRENDWQHVVSLIESPINGGFAAGNNLGIAAAGAQFYLLLNSDTVVRERAIEHLLDAAARRDAGLLSPRLEWPDGAPQVSCFYNRSPRTEFLRAAGSGPVTWMLGGRETGMPLAESESPAEWTSFAAVLIRQEVFEQIGHLDDGYFMYFEDIDFCRRAREAGWSIVNVPASRVVHLRGGSSSVKSAGEKRDRLPRYYYESRSRYFKKFYGHAGLWLTNLLWFVGSLVTRTRALFRRGGHHHLCAREGLDNWIGAFEPVQHKQSPVEITHATA